MEELSVPSRLRTGQVLAAIQRMTRTLSGRMEPGQAGPCASSARESEPCAGSGTPSLCGPSGCATGCTGCSPEGRGWWVLAVGPALDEHDFDRREAAREELRRQVVGAGIHLIEHVWVWDETGHAQVVLARFADEHAARAWAAERGHLGLTLRVAQELDEP